MNRDCYRLVFSDLLNAWVPVAETLPARGKPGRSARKLALAAVLLSLSHLAEAASLTPGTLPNCPGGVCPANFQPTVTLGGANALNYQVSGGNGYITQNVAKVSATWNSFDISRDASVTMTQPKGGSALFRVMGGQYGFTQIEGALNVGYNEAGKFVPGGSLFLLNQNGVLFTNGASANAGTLVASSLRLSDSKFNSGILSDKSAAAFGDDDPATGFVRVESGAKLTAYAGGKLMLLAPQVENGGTLSAPDGQVVLAAGSRVYLASSEDVSMRGLWVEVDNPDLVSVARDAGTGLPTGAGVAVNAATGTITTDRGNTTMIGLAVNQMGRVSAKTAVATNGSIRLLARDTTSPVDATSPRTDTATRGGTVTLGQSSVTEVLPDSSDSATSLDAQTFTPSRIDLVGATIQLKAGAAIKAPGGNVSLMAGQNPSLMGTNIDGQPPNASRILLEAGSSIDVHGSSIDLPMSRNVIAVELRGDELKDSPLLRYGVLRNKTVYVDIRKGTSIADISGYLAQIGRTVSERTTGGGTVTLKSEGDVITQVASSIDISGGSVAYQAGVVNTTKLLSGGRLYDIGDRSGATADITYTGVASGSSYTVSDKWGSHTYALNLPVTSSESAYTDYKSAGTLSIISPYAYLGGAINGTGQSGANQRTGAANGGSLIIGNPGASTATGTPDYRTLSDVLLTRANASLSADWSADDALPASLKATLNLSTDVLAQSGLAKVKVYTNGKITVAEDATLTLPPGGSLALTGHTVDVRSDVSVPAGTITMTARPTLGRTASDISTLEVGPGVTLSTRGMWVNDQLDSQAGVAPGKALINGGSISLGSYDDLILASGSTLDVSAGGQLSTLGKFSYGKGGDVTLAAQSGKKDGGLPLGGGLLFGGTVKGYAVGNGGTFSLSTGNVTVATAGMSPFINGDAIGAAVDDLAAAGQQGGNRRLIYDGIISSVRAGTTEADVVVVLQARGYSTEALDHLRADLAVMGMQMSGTLNIAADAISQGGFSNYALTGLDGLTVAAGAQLRPRTENWVVDAAAASRLASGGNLASVAVVDTLPQWRRTAASLTLAAGASGRVLNGNLLTEAGSAIMTDPGATISLTARNQLTTHGNITALGGGVNLTLEGDPATAAIDDAAQSIWIGNGSHISVAGTFVKNEDGSLFTRGKVYAGGSINVNAKVGYVVTEEGSSMVIKGASAELDSSTVAGVRGRVDTAGGSISIAARRGIYLDGEFSYLGEDAGGGSTAVQGGSLTVTLDHAKLSNVLFTDDNYLRTLDVLASGAATPTGMAPGATLDPLTGGSGAIRADRISAGNFSSVTLKAEDRISFPQSLNLHTPLALTLNTPEMLVHDGVNVSLSTYALTLANTLNFNSSIPAVASLAPLAGSGTFAASGDVVDFVGPLTFSGMAAATITSTGDMRLGGVLPPGNTAVFSPYGALAIDGDLSLQANRLYPTTLTQFDIQSGGTFSMTSPMASTAIPYSVGGRVTVHATDIEQAGTIRAPFGSIVLTADQTLDLASGSITSVSAEGVTIPFGLTQNGSEWAYDFGDRIALITAPPKGTVSLNGADVAINPNAVVNVSGGGELSAYEFTAGPGGSKDVLADATTYALVPGWSDSLAPVDYQANLISRPVTGQRIYISGGSGLAAGIYTLLPSSYALRNDGFTIKVGTVNRDIASSGNGSKLNGASTVSGYLVNGDGTRTDSRWSSYTLTPISVVRTQSEYSQTTASAFFSTLASKNGSATPALPRDAGLISISATHGLVMDGTLSLDAPGGGQRGGLDIAAPAIIVTSGDTTPEAGVIKLSASKLNSFGAGSLMLGATRVSSANETTATVVADKVTVGNDADSVLKASEIVLAAKDSVVINDGAAIEATGVAAATPAKFSLVSDTGSHDVAAVIRLSTGGETTISRAGAIPVNPLDGDGHARGIAVGASSLKSSGSLQLDALYQNTLDPLAQLTAPAISLAAGKVGVGDGAAAADTLAVTPALIGQMSGLSSLTLRSFSSIDLYAVAGGAETGLSADLGLSRIVLDTPLLQAVESGVTASFSAANIVLKNTSGIATPAAVGGSGQLTFHAVGADAGQGRITLGEGTKKIAGFEQVTLSADRDIVSIGTGATSVAQSTAGVLELGAALVSGANGSNQSIVGDGTVRITSRDTANVTRAGAGGILSISGARLEQGGHLDLAGGTLTLTAMGPLATDGVELLAGSTTRAEGVGLSINDFLARADAGTINLISTSGNVEIKDHMDATPTQAAMDRAEVSVAAGSGKNAGYLNISAAKGKATVSGKLSGKAGTRGVGGNISIDALTLGSGAGNDLVGLNNHIRSQEGEGGFDHAIAVRVRSGDLAVVAGSGNTIKASSVNLTADDGSILVAGTIDASGATGGRIGLYAKAGASGAGLVTLLGPDGKLLANATGARSTGNSGDGGQVLLSGEGGSTQQVLLSGGTIDVSANDVNASAGSITLRAPRTIVSSDLTAINAGGSATAMTVPDPSLSAYTFGSVVTFKATRANTGAVTLNVNGKGAKSLVKDGGAAMVAGDITVGQVLTAVYDGTKFQLTSRTADASATPSYGTGVAIAPIASTLVGTSTVNVEANRIYAYDQSAGITFGTSNSSASNLSQAVVKADNLAFMARESTITSSLAGGRSDISFKLRPGVEIRNTGDITVSNDLDLASVSGGVPQWRYGSALLGGSLALRAAGNLKINGSVNDGLSKIASGATLLSGDSWSYRLVGGADLSSANSLAVIASTTSGDVAIAAGKFVRTGIGSIEVAAGRNVTLGNVSNPNTVAATAATASSIYTVGENFWDGLTSLIPGVNLAGNGGIVSISATGDIASVASNQLANAWFDRQGDYDGIPVGWGANYDALLKLPIVGALGGGDVKLTAGGNVTNVSTAASNSAYADPDNLLHVLGRGNLDVRAGNDIRGGTYFAADGQVSLRAGHDLTNARAISGRSVYPLVQLMKGSADVAAANALTLESVANPTLMPMAADNLSAGSYSVNSQPLFSTYDINNKVLVTALGGDLTLDGNATLLKTNLGAGSVGALYPGYLQAVALQGSFTQNGGIVLTGAPEGGLDIVAQGNVNVSGIRIRDVMNLPTPENKLVGSDTNISALINSSYTRDAGHGGYTDPVTGETIALLHGNDFDPIRIYAATGDVKGGTLISPKAVKVNAARDISNLNLSIQHLSPDQDSSLVAGRDIVFSVARQSNNELNTNSSKIEVGGEGIVSLIAGRNVDLGNSDGVVTIGNLYNSALPATGASIVVSAGAAGGGDFSAILNTYVNPAAAESLRAAEYLPRLLAYVQGQTGNPGLAADQAWTTFQTLSSSQQQTFARKVFFAELKAAGDAFNATDNPDKSYARGNAAISRLFPDGQTYSGDINVFFSQLKTQQGGDIHMFAPGGKIVAGLTNVPTKLIDNKKSNIRDSAGNVIDDSASRLGIMTLRGGDVMAMAHGDFLVNQSRVFTLNGTDAIDPANTSDILLWSSTGNIDAGKGKKTAVSAPPPIIRTDSQGNVVVDSSGAVSGSGIGSLKTVAANGPSNVDLIAPKGEVNAGDAGIRVSGNLNIAAQRVTGLDNIQVGGASSGVPAGGGGTVVASTAGLGNSEASRGAGAAAAALGPSAGLKDPTSIFNVEISGFGP